MCYPKILVLILIPTARRAWRRPMFLLDERALCSLLQGEAGSEVKCKTCARLHAPHALHKRTCTSHTSEPPRRTPPAALARREERGRGMRAGLIRMDSRAPPGRLIRPLLHACHVEAKS